MKSNPQFWMFRTSNAQMKLKKKLVKRWNKTKGKKSCCIKRTLCSTIVIPVIVCCLPLSRELQKWYWRWTICRWRTSFDPKKGFEVLSPEFSTKFRELSIGFVAFDVFFVHIGRVIRLLTGVRVCHRRLALFFLGPAFSQIGLWRLLAEIVMILQMNKSFRDVP